MKVSYLTVKGMASGIIFAGSTPGNMALWFLLSLFCIRLIYAFCHSRRLWALFAVIILVAPAMHFYGLDRPYWLANISEGLLWYSLGYLLRNLRITDLWAALLLTALWCASIFLFPNMIDMRSNHVLEGYYLLAYPQALLGIFAINALFQSTPFLNIKPLVHIGRRSMGYYCMHWIVLIGVGIFFDSASPTRGWTYFFIALTAMAILLPLAVYALSRSKRKTLID